MNNRGLMGQYAGFITRALGLILDIIIIIVLTAVIYMSITLPFKFFLSIDPATCAAGTSTVRPETQFLCSVVVITNAFISILVGPLYFILLVTIGGQTIGHYVAGVRVVRVDGKRMSLWRSFIRWIGLMVDLIAIGIGFLWVLIDDRRQGWHDKMAGTVVLYSWEAEQNEFLLDRVRLMMNKGRNALAKLRKHDEKPTTATGPAKNYDLVTIAFQDYGRMDNILNQIQSEVVRGKVSIVNATVLAKGPDGSIGVVGISDLATGSALAKMTEAELSIPDYEVSYIMADVANDSFVIAVVLEEQWADQLTKTVARSTQAVIRRYDLGNAPEPERAMLSAEPTYTARSVMQRPTLVPLTSAAAPAATSAPAAAVAAAPQSAVTTQSSLAAAPAPAPVPAVLAPHARKPIDAAPVASTPVAPATIPPPAVAPVAPPQPARPPAPALSSAQAPAPAQPATKTNGNTEIVWPDLSAKTPVKPSSPAGAVSPTGGTPAAPAVSPAVQANAPAVAPQPGPTTPAPAAPAVSERAALTVEPVVHAAPAASAPAAPALSATVAPVPAAPSPAAPAVVVVEPAASSAPPASAPPLELVETIQVVGVVETAETVEFIVAEKTTTRALPATGSAPIPDAPVSFKTQARLAAAQYGYPDRTTAAVQDLEAAKHIGEVYEQRLYRAGVGTFWELAHVSDAEFVQFLKFGELQKQTIDCSDIRRDGLRLAIASNTAGLLWAGETPDDFEPLEGIGRVFERKLYQAGIYTYRALAAATPEQLAAICPAPKGLEPDYASWIEQAKARLFTAVL